MTERPGHLFVERQTYRRRRLEDAARFLPVLGIVLILVPLFWVEGADGVSMSGAVRYLFSVWALLVVAAFVMSLYLRNDKSAEEDNASVPPKRGPGRAP